METKKELIIQSAIHVFQEKGIDKTKVSDIVKGAGIAQGTFYLYFSSKFSVVPSIAEVMVEKTMIAIKSRVNPNTSFSSQLETVVDTVFDLTKEYRAVFAIIYTGLAATEHLKEWEDIYKPYYAWMAAFLQKAKDAGAIRDSLHPDRTAEILIGLIESAAEQAFLYAPIDMQSAKIKKAEVLNFLAHALGLNE